MIMEKNNTRLFVRSICVRNKMILYHIISIEKPIQSILIPRIPEGTEIGENHTEEIFTEELEDDYNKELHFNDIR